MTPELEALRRHMGELSDLGSIGGLLFWDQQTMMPPGGATARADAAATLARVIHARETSTELGALLAALEPWAAEQDPDSDDARLVCWVRRDYEKAVRVPEDLAAEMTRAKALGQQAWLEARAANDFSPFRDALAQQVELRHRYVACFEGFAHPYDALLDDFEPGLTTAELRPLFAELRDALVPLVNAAGDAGQERNDGAFKGEFDAESQRVAVLDVLEAVGFDPDRWRLDPTLHPFASGIAADDVRLTTRYDEQRLRRRAVLGAARVRPRPLRGGVRSRGCCARRSTTRCRSASTSRRAACGRTWSAARGRSAPGCSRACRRRSPAPSPGSTPPAVPRRQHGAAVADPHRGRRDHLQPPHHPALRARAGADRGLARDR